MTSTPRTLGTAPGASDDEMEHAPVMDRRDRTWTSNTTFDFDEAAQQQAVAKVHADAWQLATQFLEAAPQLSTLQKLESRGGVWRDSLGLGLHAFPETVKRQELSK